MPVRRVSYLSLLDKDSLRKRLEFIQICYKIVKTMTDIFLTYSRPQPCPCCGSPVDSTGGDQVHHPREILVCSQCTHFIVFDDNFILRAAAKEDFSGLSHQVRNQLNQLKLKVIVDQEKARLKH
jgi:hypothetical protein